MDILISNLLQKSIFDFRKWSNWKYTYSRIREFSVWPLPEVENWFLKQIWNENVNISILIFFFWAFRSVLKKSKKINFPFYFQNVIWLGGIHFFIKKISEKAKHLRMCPGIGGNVGETWLRRGPIITPPYYRKHRPRGPMLWKLEASRWRVGYQQDLPRLLIETIKESEAIQTFSL